MKLAETLDDPIWRNWVLQAKAELQFYQYNYHGAQKILLATLEAMPDEGDHSSDFHYYVWPKNHEWLAYTLTSLTIQTAKTEQEYNKNLSLAWDSAQHAMKAFKILECQDEAAMQLLSLGRIRFNQALVHADQLIWPLHKGGYQFYQTGFGYIQVIGRSDR